MEEAMKRQMNKRVKEAINETVTNSKMQATQRQKQMALETKADKQMAR